MAKVMEGLIPSRNYSMMLELFSQMPSLGVSRDSRHVSLAVTVSDHPHLTYFSPHRVIQALVRTHKISKALALIRTFESAGEQLRHSFFALLS
jgi:hypothetical protein